ncbi:hypothetical protein H2203_002053 [Taxawa tesnikishii (nom. ined.)]|nr:hypothetical protein H2203_002053 [Dothideales sp. JES 119]
MSETNSQNTPTPPIERGGHGGRGRGGKGRSRGRRGRGGHARSHDAHREDDSIMPNEGNSVMAHTPWRFPGQHMMEQEMRREEKDRDIASQSPLVSSIALGITMPSGPIFSSSKSDPGGSDHDQPPSPVYVRPATSKADDGYLVSTSGSNLRGEANLKRGMLQAQRETTPGYSVSSASNTMSVPHGQGRNNVVESKQLPGAAPRDQQRNSERQHQQSRMRRRQHHLRRISLSEQDFLHTSHHICGHNLPSNPSRNHCQTPSPANSLLNLVTTINSLSLSTPPHPGTLLRRQAQQPSTPHVAVDPGRSVSRRDVKPDDPFADHVAAIAALPASAFALLHASTIAAPLYQTHVTPLDRIRLLLTAIDVEIDSLLSVVERDRSGGNADVRRWKEEVFEGLLMDVVPRVGELGAGIARAAGASMEHQRGGVRLWVGRNGSDG